MVRSDRCDVSKTHSLSDGRKIHTSGMKNSQQNKCSFEKRIFESNAFKHQSLTFQIFVKTIVVQQKHSDLNDIHCKKMKAI